MRRALALVVLLGLVSAAAGHGVLERSEPRGGSVLKSAPAQVRLTFTGAIEPAYSRVRVLDGGGRPVAPHCAVTSIGLGRLPTRRPGRACSVSRA